jgi:hypothetical protein
LACATYLPPSPPLAPGLLSMMNVWPNASCILDATVRAVMSEEPPGVNGTTMVTGLSGYCASAAPQSINAAAQAARGASLMGSPRMVMSGAIRAAIPTVPNQAAGGRWNSKRNAKVVSSTTIA